MDDIKNTTLASSYGNPTSPLTPSTSPNISNVHFSTDADIPPPPPNSTPAPFAPPVVHEEVSLPPVLPSSTVAPVPPVTPQAQPVNTTNTATNLNAPNTPSGNNNIPPVIIPPQKPGEGKMFAAIAGIILLLITIPVGIILVRQNQEVREKADGEDLCTPGEYRRNCNGGNMTYDLYQCNDSGQWESQGEEADGNICPSTTPIISGGCADGTNDCLTPNPPPGSGGGPTPPIISGGCADGTNDCLTPNPPPGSGGGPTPPIISGGCADGTNDCLTTPTPTGTSPGTGNPGVISCPGIENAGPLVHAGTVDVNLGNQQYASCSVVTNFLTQYGDFAGRAWTVQRICSNNVTAACDGQNLITQSADIVQQYISQHNQSACSQWATAHNTAVNNCNGGACIPLILYKYPYNSGILAKANYSSLKPGDTIKICAATTANPKFKINGGLVKTATDTGPGGEKCYIYDIPNNTTSLNITGEI